MVGRPADQSLHAFAGISGQMTDGGILGVGRAGNRALTVNIASQIWLVQTATPSAPKKLNYPDISSRRASSS